MSIDREVEFVATVTFDASDLNTDMAAEWDRICDIVETRIRLARDRVLQRVATSALVIIKIEAKHRHP